MVQTKREIQSEESNVQVELRELIQEIAQYSIDNVIVKNLNNIEQKYVEALPVMERQIKELKTTVVQLEKEKERILSGIKSEHTLLVQDRSRLDHLKKDITDLSKQTKDALLSLTNENLQLRKKIDQAMSENIEVKKTISTVSEATGKVEMELAKTTNQIDKLAETTKLNFEISDNFQQKNHKITLYLLITTIVIQFGIITFFVV